MADVPLLEPLINDGPEAGHVRASRFENCKWRNRMTVVKVVINVEVLLTIDAVVEAERKLVAALGLYGSGHKLPAAISRNRHIFQHQVDSRGIHALERNLVGLTSGRVGKNISIVYGARMGRGQCDS